MVTISSELLQTWIISLLWPLTRVLGMVASAPLFSERAIPVRIKLGVGLMITLAILPMLPTIPAFDLFSLQGLLILVQQMIIGIAIGFSMRLVFAAIGMVGQLVGMSMGIGFATFFDPSSQSQNTALSQFLTVLAMLVFLSLDGHLIMVTVLAESFMTMPIALDGNRIEPLQIAMWGEMIFSTGLLIAMPAVSALLITNMALGVLTRTAPQLNLFGIGFPVTLSIGFLVLALSMQGMLNPLQHLIQEGINHMRQIALHAA